MLVILGYCSNDNTSRVPMSPTLSADQQDALLDALQARFEKNMHRHKSLKWADVEARLKAHPEKLRSLDAMEETGGEPDIVGHDKKSGALIIMDCSAESPKGRRSICYDREGLESRKEHRPANSAVEMAAEMGVELLTEAQYRDLQKLEAFDRKTSSWVLSPASEARRCLLLRSAIRCLCSTYHNGAQSYYGGRAFEACLKFDGWGEEKEFDGFEFACLKAGRKPGRCSSRHKPSAYFGLTCEVALMLEGRP